MFRATPTCDMNMYRVFIIIHSWILNVYQWFNNKTENISGNNYQCGESDEISNMKSA